MSGYPPFYKNEIRRYPFLLLLIPFVCGVLFQRNFTIPPLTWTLLFFIAGIATIFFHNLRAASILVRLARNMGMMLLLLFLAALLSYYQDARNNSGWYGNRLELAEQVYLKMDKPAEIKARTIMVPVTVVSLYIDHKWELATGSLKLYIYKQAALSRLKPGDGLVVPADKIIPVRNSGNPFAFDYAAYAGRKGLFHQGFISWDDAHYLPGSGYEQSWFARIRAGMIRNIRQNITDSTTAALVEATMLNERNLLDDEIWKAYSTTGIVHIIAISGMHVTLLFNILLFFLLWIKNKKLEWLKYFIAIPLVWFYVGITGFPPSAVRAAAMFTLLAFGIRLNRETNSVNILMATAFILLCFNPFWLYDPGFQLSFLAVLSILIFYPSVKKQLYFRNKPLRFLWETFSVSLAAQVLTFPLAIYYFHQFPLWVLIANVPAAIFSLVLMIGSIVLLAIGSFIPCTWLGDILTLLTRVFHKIIIVLSDHTPQYFRELFIDEIDFWLLMLLITLVAVSFFKRNKSYLVAGIITFVALSADIALQYYTAETCKRVVVYNIPRISIVDFFEGRTVQRYGSLPDSLDKKTVNYTLLPAQLGYHVKQVFHRTGKPYWLLQGRRICFLSGKEQAGPGASSRTDYLIVCNNCDFSPEYWQRVYNPRKIIIDGSLPRWKAIKWRNTLLQSGIPVHWVQEDGAWIFPE